MTKTTKRSSNIELLRVIAMLMIVLHHIVVHCVNTQLGDSYSISRLKNGYFSYPVFYNRVALLNFAVPLGPIANLLFLIVSGYFMANKEPRSIDLAKSVKKLITQLAFASIVLIVVSNIWYLFDNSNYPGLLTYSCFNGNSWYIGYYFIVILIGKLFLNKFLINCDKRKYLEFLLVLLGLSQFSWANSIVNNFVNGFDVLLIGVFSYAMGGYIKRYDPFSKIRSFVFILIIALSFYAVYLNIFDITATNIQNYIANGNTGDFTQTVAGISMNSIIVILITISLFELFRRINLPSSRFINYLGSGTFMVYLMHDNNFFYMLWNKTDWITLLHESAYKFIWNWLLWALLVLLIGIVCYWLYNLTRMIFHRTKFLIMKSKD